jgi:hypothetical protein
MNKTILLLSIIAVSLTALADDDVSAKAAFQQTLAEYQKLESPGHEAAEKVIQLALALDKLPAIPEEARRRFVRAGVMFKEAKTPDEFAQTVKEYREATRLAPWWREARYDQALAQEAEGDYPGAIWNLKLCQLFKLSETEARTVQDVIYALEAKAELAQKRKSEQEQAAAAEPEAKQPEEKEQDKIDPAKGAKDAESYRQIGLLAGKYLEHLESVFKRGGSKDWSDDVGLRYFEIEASGSSVDIYYLRKNGERESSPYVHGEVSGADDRHIAWKRLAVTGAIAKPELPIEVTIDKASGTIRWKELTWDVGHRHYEDNTINEYTLTKVDR